MKLAIIGSRSIDVENLEKYIPSNVSEIVSGGARGVDRSAEQYAKQNGIKLTVFLPHYDLYGKTAPLKRNDQIAAYADAVLAFWDGSSRGTIYTLRAFHALNKPIRLFRLVPDTSLN
jgi:predicted Rossmann fold nucleotide-binding protein DprA/Smf involved in DNA uptake